MRRSCHLLRNEQVVSARDLDCSVGGSAGRLIKLQPVNDTQFLGLLALLEDEECLRLVLTCTSREDVQRKRSR